MTPTTATEVAITASYLANSTTWTASAQEVNAQAVSWGLNVVVICALVAP